MNTFSPVHTFIVLRAEYYNEYQELEDAPPNWERVARILHVPNDEALYEHIKELSVQAGYGSFWARSFLHGERYKRAYTRKKAKQSEASKLREQKLRKIWSMLEQRLTYREMAELTGYSLTTVHELMRTLERREVITREVIGGHGTYKIEKPFNWIDEDV